MRNPSTKAGQWLVDRSEWIDGDRAFRVRINATAGPDDMLRHVLSIEDEARDPLATALLRWYDTTHGNGFGHDHHCPAPWSDEPYIQPIFDGCTCGWSDVQRAEQARPPAQDASET